MPREKKVVENLSINPKKGRHMPRKVGRSKDVQSGHVDSRVRTLELENQAMKAKLEEIEKVLERFIIGPKGLDMYLSGQRSKNTKLGPSKTKRRSSAKVAHDIGKGGVTKDKGESSKANKKEYARVTYNYGKDDVSKVKGKKKLTKDKMSKVKKVSFVGQVSPEVHRSGLSIVDESPREVTKAKIPKVRKSLWDPW